MPIGRIAARSRDPNNPSPTEATSAPKVRTSHVSCFGPVIHTNERRWTMGQIPETT
jgi:hypothetical protein